MRTSTMLPKPPPAVAPMKFAALLAGLGDRDRASLERQILAYETKVGAAPAQRWRRLACLLKTLAPGPVKLGGSNTMQFFIPDGKYRKQVFALQALPGGGLTIYAPDVLPEATASGLLSELPHGDDHNLYRLARSQETLAIDPLDSRTPNPDAFYKDLTGWNRKAIRMTLPAHPGELQVKAVEQLCTLAATQWPAALAE